MTLVNHLGKCRAASGSLHQYPHTSILHIQACTHSFCSHDQRGLFRWMVAHFTQPVSLYSSAPSSAVKKESVKKKLPLYYYNKIYYILHYTTISKHISKEFFYRFTSLSYFSFFAGHPWMANISSVLLLASEAAAVRGDGKEKDPGGQQWADWWSSPSNAAPLVRGGWRGSQGKT